MATTTFSSTARVRRAGRPPRTTLRDWVTIGLETLLALATVIALTAALGLGLPAQGPDAAPEPGPAPPVRFAR